MTSIAKALANRDAQLKKDRDEFCQDLIAFAKRDSTAADFEGVTADEYKALKTGFEDLAYRDREWSLSATHTKTQQWSTSFLNAQVDNPQAVTDLLESGTMTSDVADMKKKPLLALLKAQPKQEWCDKIAGLERCIAWTVDEIQSFPIELCRAYIAHDLQVERRDFYDEYDRVPWLVHHEAFFCQLAKTFFSRLSLDEKRAIARRIYRHSLGDCPPGGTIRRVEAKKGNNDLLLQIADIYKTDPLSAMCESLRNMVVFSDAISRSGPYQKSVRTARICHDTTRMHILMPNLCYMFATSVVITWHHSQWSQQQLDFNAISAHPGRVGETFPAMLHIDKKKHEDDVCERPHSLKTHTITLPESVSKSIHIGVPLFTKVHSVKVYGTALLLF